jgi:hypothetical protein
VQAWQARNRPPIENINARSEKTQSPKVRDPKMICDVATALSRRICRATAPVAVTEQVAGAAPALQFSASRMEVGEKSNLEVRNPKQLQNIELPSYAKPAARQSPSFVLSKFLG